MTSAPKISDGTTMVHRGTIGDLGCAGGTGPEEACAQGLQTRFATGLVLLPARAQSSHQAHHKAASDCFRKTEFPARALRGSGPHRCSAAGVPDPAFQARPSMSWPVYPRLLKGLFQGSRDLFLGLGQTTETCGFRVGKGRNRHE